MNATVAVANANPDVYFMHCSGFKTTANMGTYFARIFQADYLVGLMAAEVSQNDSIGYVAPIKIPEVYRGVNAFTIGVLERKPNAKVFVKWVGDWYDPAKEAQIAQELVDLGVDVLAHGQDSPAVNEVAEQHGLPSFGYNSDMSKYAPDSHLTAPVWNWAVFYKYYCQMVYNGEWQVGESWWGYDKDAVRLSPFSNKVTSDISLMVEDKIEKIKKGEFVIFKGPLYDNSGTLRYNQGQQATYIELLSMSYLIKGVVEL